MGDSSNSRRGLEPHPVLLVSQEGDQERNQLDCRRGLGEGRDEVRYLDKTDLDLLVVKLAGGRYGVRPRPSAGRGHVSCGVGGVGYLSIGGGIGVVGQLGAEFGEEVELHRLGY